MKLLKRLLIQFFVTLIYGLGCLCYDKKYLTGRYFDRKHFTVGWKWILQYWFGQKIMRKNAHVPWPVPPHICIADPKHILFDPNDMDMFHTTGNYFQGIGADIIFGRGCMIAPGTGFVTANHDPLDVTKSAPAKPIKLGEHCIVSMNAVILPGVELGPHTIVGANAVVNKSFPEGYCVIAGCPAKMIRKLESPSD